MSTYLVTNITNLGSSPKTIYITDIPNAGTIAISPGSTINLEQFSTRNQILDSKQLRVHVEEGRATIDTQETSPRDRIFVDANIAGLTIEEVSITAPIPIAANVSGIDVPLTATTSSGRTYLDVHLQNDTNFGVVGANTLRTAAEIGNTLGAADFNSGSTTAQTLRTASNLSDGYGNKISSTDGALNSWIAGGEVINIPTPSMIDAFARQRVSMPFTLGDYKHIYGLDPNLLDYTTNGGSVIFQANKACARLATSSDPSSRAVHQSKMYHHYMPGKSQLILSSFCFFDPTANVTKRTGYYDDNNGIFFEQAGNGTLAVVIRSYATGTPSEIRISRYGGVYGTSDTGWLDPCDGYGASGYNLQINKTQLIAIDFQWLGVGRIRVGFAHAGTIIPIAEFNGSNNLDTVYMSNPNLPSRCEIVNTGTTTGGYFDQICSTVVSEGGYVEAGQDWATISPSFRTVTVSGATQTLPILAIRLKSSFNGYNNRMIARLGEISVFSESGNVQYQVVKLPSAANLTGGTGVWTPADSASGVEYLADATGFSSANVLATGFAASATQGGNKAGSGNSYYVPSSAKRNFIAQNYNCTSSEVYAVIVKNIDTKDTKISVSMQWREIY